MFKSITKLLNPTDDIGDDFEKWFFSEPPTLLESYIDGWMDFHVHIFSLDGLKFCVRYRSMRQGGQDDYRESSVFVDVEQTGKCKHPVLSLVRLLGFDKNCRAREYPLSFLGTQPIMKLSGQKMTGSFVDVTQDIASDWANIGREVLGYPLSPYDVVSRIKVILTEHLCDVSFLNGLNLCVRGVEMMYCPGEFYPGPDNKHRLVSLCKGE